MGGHAKRETVYSGNGNNSKDRSRGQALRHHDKARFVGPEPE